MGAAGQPALECVHIHVWAAQGEVTREATRESREHVGHDCAGALGEESIERPEAWERRVQPSVGAGRDDLRRVQRTLTDLNAERKVKS